MPRGGHLGHFIQEAIDLIHAVPQEALSFPLGAKPLPTLDGFATLFQCGLSTLDRLVEHP